MSTIFQNAILLRVSCDSDHYDESLAFAVFEFDKSLQRSLLGFIKRATRLKRWYSSFYWADFGDFTPTWVTSAAADSLIEERVGSEDVVYLPWLDIPDNASPNVDYSILRADERAIQWRMGIKHTTYEWSTTWFLRRHIETSLSPVRFLVDRYKEKQREVQAAQA